MIKEIQSYFYRVGQRIKSQREGRTNTTHTLIHSAKGLSIESLTIENEINQVSFSWAEVQAISAFKVDLLVVDCICLSFEFFNGTYLEINEEMEGWSSLLNAMPSYLRGFNESWFADVAIPAFETNLIEIYRRDSEI